MFLKKRFLASRMVKQEEDEPAMALINALSVNVAVQGALILTFYFDTFELEAAHVLFVNLTAGLRSTCAS